MSLVPQFEERNIGWVTEDGSYGYGGIILVTENALTDDQWERVGNMRDNDRYDYVYAIMAGEPLDDWEEN